MKEEEKIAEEGKKEVEKEKKKEEKKKGLSIKGIKKGCL